MTNGSDQKERSIYVGKAIAETTVKAFKLTPTGVIELFDELEAALITNNYNKSETLEVQRRIAEAKVSVLAGKEPSSEFEAAWNDVESLGYTDTEREASMVFYRAKYLIRKGSDKSSASNAIERLGVLVGYFNDQQSQHLADHFSQVHEKLLNDLASKFS